MHASFSIAALFLAGCFLAPGTAQTPGGAPQTRAAQLFPAPKEPLMIRVTGEQASLLTLLEDFGRVTGENLVADRDTRQALQQSRAGLLHDLEVPPERVWEITEQILVQSDFVLAPLSRTEPRMMSVRSLNTSNRANLRNDALFVPAGELAEFARHPAILVTTIVDLPNTDVRNLSNSIRTMFTDANTQQIVPVGSSNSLIITGFASSVVSIVRMLEIVDQAARPSEPAPHPTSERKPSAADEAKPVEKPH
jgi:type II secretory pathway component GspD/PulD (secretin)